MLVTSKWPAMTTDGWIYQLVQRNHARMHLAQRPDWELHTYRAETNHKLPLVT
jgi:hypothetical protein